MEKGLFGPNRYENTAIIPEKEVKTRGKAEKPVQGVNFVSKWYVIHMIYGLNRYEIQKTRFLTGFSPFSGQKRPVLSLIVAFERQ
jgi:hypothetical protein